MKEEFDFLFENTYIHEHPTKEKNSYYILNFNFSGFAGKQGDALENEFNNKVYEGLTSCIEKYKLPVKVKEDTNAARMLSRFISEMQYKNRQGDFYVIVDEYSQCAGWRDHFANDLLSFRLNEFTNVMGSSGYVRAFYTLRTHGVKKSRQRRA